MFTHPVRGLETDVLKSVSVTNFSSPSNRERHGGLSWHDKQGKIFSSSGFPFQAVCTQQRCGKGKVISSKICWGCMLLLRVHPCIYYTGELGRSRKYSVRLLLLHRPCLVSLQGSSLTSFVLPGSDTNRDCNDLYLQWSEKARAQRWQTSAWRMTGPSALEHQQQLSNLIKTFSHAQVRISTVHVDLITGDEVLYYGKLRTFF